MLVDIWFFNLQILPIIVSFISGTSIPFALSFASYIAFSYGSALISPHSILVLSINTKRINMKERTAKPFWLNIKVVTFFICLRPLKTEPTLVYGLFFWWKTVTSNSLTPFLGWCTCTLALKKYPTRMDVKGLGKDLGSLYLSWWQVTNLLCLELTATGSLVSMCQL
jgi:hypothetical protein